MRQKSGSGFVSGFFGAKMISQKEMKQTFAEDTTLGRVI
jgi:hypothetical protein